MSPSCPQRGEPASIRALTLIRKSIPGNVTQRENGHANRGHVRAPITPTALPILAALTIHASDRAVVSHEGHVDRTLATNPAALAGTTV